MDNNGTNKLSFGDMSPVMGNANQIMSQPAALNQVGPSGGPMFQPGIMQPAPNQPMGQAPQGLMGTPPTPQQSTPQPMQPAPALPPQGGTIGMPPGNPETMMILQALTHRLKSLTKVEEANKLGPNM